MCKEALLEADLRERQVATPAKRHEFSKRVAGERSHSQKAAEAETLNVVSGRDARIFDHCGYPLRRDQLP